MNSAGTALLSLQERVSELEKENSDLKHEIEFFSKNIHNNNECFKDRIDGYNEILNRVSQETAGAVLKSSEICDYRALNEKKKAKLLIIEKLFADQKIKQKRILQELNMIEDRIFALSHEQNVYFSFFEKYLSSNYPCADIDRIDSLVLRAGEHIKDELDESQRKVIEYLQSFDKCIPLMDEVQQIQVLELLLAAKKIEYEIFHRIKLLNKSKLSTLRARNIEYVPFHKKLYSISNVINSFVYK